VGGTFDRWCRIEGKRVRKQPLRQNAGTRVISLFRIEQPANGWLVVYVSMRYISRENLQYD
jgi:hypothetical protein